MKTSFFLVDDNGFCVMIPLHLLLNDTFRLQSIKIKYLKVRFYLNVLSCTEKKKIVFKYQTDIQKNTFKTNLLCISFVAFM